MKNSAVQSAVTQNINMLNKLLMTLKEDEVTGLPIYLIIREDFI